MSYDRDEWRQPWRADRPTDAPPTSAVAAGPDADRAGDMADRAGAMSDRDGAMSDRDGGMSDRDGGDALPVAAGDGATTQPIARFPQPPPSSWDDRSAGPGSPVGSVRPPDTTGTVDAPQAPARRRGGIGVALGAIAGAVIGTLATLLLTGVIGTATDPEPTTTPDTSQEGLVEPPRIEVTGEAASTVPAVAEAVTPSVVRIDVDTGNVMDAFGGSPALGSGVIYRSDGYILTNHHVVDGAENVRVRLASGELLDAEVVGSDELNDLAVVRIDEAGLPAVSLRPVDEPVIVGETVVAIGSPFGLDASVTAGVVSALNREINLDEPDADGNRLTITSVLQTDAAINPGNSGGALVDAQGRLVGINTAILTRTGASQGVGFAVSAEQAVSSADQLIEQGFVRHPLLGITGQDVSPQVAEQFDLASSQGAIVESVQPGTGADESGLRGGDIIIEVDGEQLATMAQLVAEVRRRSPGDVVELAVLRDGEMLEFEIELGERPR